MAGLETLAARVPLLWILYAGYLGLSIGCWSAAQLAGLVVRVAWPAHVIGVAGFSVMILGMVTRTALGHLGRPLQTDRSMVLSYALIIRPRCCGWRRCCRRAP